VERARLAALAGNVPALFVFDLKLVAAPKRTTPKMSKTTFS